MGYFPNLIVISPQEGFFLMCYVQPQGLEAHIMEGWLNEGG